ncbi:MAG: vWA domain-containing protein [Hyphomicrobiaceae bacterium]
MIVFDASGSMWAKFKNERQSKLVLTRSALKDALPRLRKDTRVGLAAFGHRRTNDCTDFEVLEPLAPLDPARIAAATDRLNPKGRSPLALAIKDAAQALGGTAAGGIVLIHDDPDNCQQDPCAAAAEINRTHPGVAIQVVSVGQRLEDAQRMACVARITGGKLHDAQTPGELTKAISDALIAASLSPGTAVPPPRPVTRDERRPLKPGLHLTAALSAGGETLDVPVRWRIGRTGDTSGNALYQGENATLSLFDLPSGRYDIDVQWGLVSAKQTVDVDTSATQQVDMILNGGTIRLATTGQRGAMSGPVPVFAISKPLAGARGASTARPGDPLIIIRTPQSEIALPAGPYVVSLTHGLYRNDKSVIVAAGTRGRLDMPLMTGEIELQASATPNGAPLENAVFQILEDDPDAPQGRRELARSSAVRPSFTLAAGTYHIVVRHGAAEVRERVAVRPGEVERRTIVTGSARLSLSSTIAGGRPDSTDVAVYRVLRLDAQPVEVAQASRLTATFDLAPGRYRIESRLGPLNARAERTIDLKPGAKDEIVMDHDAGVVRLILTEPQGSQLHSDVFWEVKDPSGRTVWLTNEAQPIGILKAGAYSVQAEHRDRRIEAKFEVKPRDNRIIQFTAQPSVP